MFAAIPRATSAPRRVPRPSISVTPMNVSVRSVIQPKKVQFGIITPTRKSRYAPNVGYWISCWTQYQRPPPDFRPKSSEGTFQADCFHQR